MNVHYMDKSSSVPYWNPYLVGVGIGFLIIISFLFAGRGLGAIGAFSTFFSSIIAAVAPEHAASNRVFSSYLGSNFLSDWVVLEIVGVGIGGMISGIHSRRFRFEVIRGPRISPAARIAFAFSGGLLMAFAAKLTRGCTSGLALSGGAVLSPGAWLFMISVFLGGYMVARPMRKLWN